MDVNSIIDLQTKKLKIFMNENKAFMTTYIVNNDNTFTIVFETLKKIDEQKVDRLVRR